MEGKYITAKELQQELNISYKKALVVINEAERIMKKKKYFILDSKPKMVLTSIVKEMLGI